jgi:hypothetical protein
MFPASLMAAAKDYTLLHHVSCTEYLNYEAAKFSKCFGAGTTVLLYNGGVKTVEEIVIGDVLMGDDSTARTVLSLTRGHTQNDAIIFAAADSKNTSHAHLLSEPAIAPATYLIRTSNPGHQQWTCNGDHILVLQINRGPWVDTAPHGAKGYVIKYFELVAVRSVPSPAQVPVIRVLATDEKVRNGDERALVFDTQDLAGAFLAAYGDVWRPLEFECTVNDFYGLSELIRDSCKFFQPELVVFPAGGASSLKARLEVVLGRKVDDQLVADTAWVLGIWSVLATRTD